MSLKTVHPLHLDKLDVLFGCFYYVNGTYKQFFTTFALLIPRYTMSRKLIMIVMAILVSLVPVSVCSQNLYFKHLGINDGLSQVRISSLYQDEFGAMWIGTSEGINRYNGVSTIRFQENRNDSIWSDRNVTQITGNKKGSVYVVSGNNLLQIHLKTGEVNCLKRRGVVDIFSEKDTLWCTCKDGIYYYTEQDKELQFFTKRSPNLYQFSHIYAKGNKLYAITAGSVFVLDKNNPEKHDKITDIGSTTLCIYVDSHDNIWVGSSNGVYRFTPDREMTNFNSDPEKGGLSHTQVRSVTEDAYGNIWLGTFMGLDCYNRATGEWKHYTQYGDSPNTLSHTSVLSLYTDSKGNIWAGTYLGGINIFNPNPDTSYFYHTAPLRDDWLNFHFVGKMAKDDQGNVWICTEGGGINVFNVADGHFRHLMHKPGDPTTPGSNNLKSIYYNPKNGKMYVGAHWGGLYIYDTRTGKGRCIKHDKQPDSLPDDIVNDIVPYQNGLILLTQGGVTYMDTQTERFAKLPVANPAREVLGRKYTYETLTLDGRDRLWLGHTNGGVTCVNLRTSGAEYFELDSVKKSSVSHIYEDPRGEIYVCTLGSGFFHYVNHKNFFTPYVLSDSQLSNNYCYYAYTTQRPGYLYILNDNGISLFDTFKERTLVTNRIFNQSYSQGSGMFRGDSGKLYIGGSNGLAVINENIFINHDHKSPIVPDRLFVYNREIVPGDSTGILKDVLQNTDKITLDYKMNNLTFEFATFDYLDNIHHPYEYSLEGFDNSWNLANGKRITYTSLPPGHYTLKVRNIVPGKEETPFSSLAITVTPPFYASPVAYALYALAVLLIATFIIRNVIRQATLRTSLIYERNEKDRIKELNRMKIDFFTNISHELRTPLTLMLVQLEGLMHYGNVHPSVGNKLQKVYHNALNLLNLSSELTDFEKQTVGKIKAEELDIVGYTKQIHSSFGELAKKKGIYSHFSSTASSLNLWFDPKQMYKVLSHLMNHALLLGESEKSREVYMEISHSKSNVRISITNVGIDLPADKLRHIFNASEEEEQVVPSAQPGGIGFSFVKKIVEMHHGNIVVENIPDKGVAVTLSLQTGNHHFALEELKQNDEKCVVVDPGTGADDEIPFDEVGTAEAGTPSDETDSGIRKPEILLVENNEDLCQVLKDVLQPIYTLHITHHGMGGLELAGSLHPDIVVCDQQLPGLSGKELCYKIKNNVELADISVVVISNADSPEAMIELLRAGADDYIAKPFDVRLFCARIRSILKNKKRLVAWCGSNVNTGTTEADAISESDRKLLKQCIEIIRDNFEDPGFDVTALSNKLYLGRSTFYSKFRQIAGVSPSEFIMKIKLEEAMRLLKTTRELNVSDISVRLGFSSPRYFSKVFKNFFGVTPQSVRGGRPQPSR